ncbi:hypothetical protein FJU31_05565 [Stenotrophomonas cyclobalanopsidis]|uniref:Uncharacterized protein n=1 Tax=Stenotrophomonas cyclobalanopsidis TaxID=2771362 RepID=A0ABQ6T350_9GAMM|nr:hypothetical protein [Stenotrophomonas cyclobalanopsidis]KAA9001435.1 hypothetical protein FJU31_05565 [Stenotrophomonas cyclobalanopsidis]
MSYKILYISLRRLIVERDVVGLRSRLLQHGPVLFAHALALGSPRVVADALSLLPIGERITVLRHLPHPLRDAMKPLCIGGSQRLHLQPWSPSVLALRRA